MTKEQEEALLDDPKPSLGYDRSTPITDDAWDSFDRGMCGTAYIKNRMREMELELAESKRLAKEAMRIMNGSDKKRAEAEKELELANECAKKKMESNHDLQALNAQLLRDINGLRMLKRAVQEALGTEEEGEGLVCVAREAHIAEQESAKLQRDLDRLAGDIYDTAEVFDFQDTIGGELLHDYVKRMVDKIKNQQQPT